ncbi:unnamed protein product [Linum trigynum]|uniref:Uncharacterized protein n=1 Tax=Linum trigynum TaxID=586398 RepID=A0AAV2G935_9ROSI
MSQADSGVTHTSTEKGGSAAPSVLDVLEKHLSPDPLRNQDQRGPRSHKEAPKQTKSAPSSSAPTGEEAPRVAAASIAPTATTPAPSTTNQGKIPFSPLFEFSMYVDSLIGAHQRLRSSVLTKGASITYRLRAYPVEVK